MPSVNPRSCFVFFIYNIYNNTFVIHLHFMITFILEYDKFLLYNIKNMYFKYNSPRNSPFWMKIQYHCSYNVRQNSIFSQTISKFVMKFRYIWYEFLYGTKFHWSYFLSSDEIIVYRKRCEIKNPQKRELNTSQSLFNDVPVSVVKVTMWTWKSWSGITVKVFTWSGITFGNWWMPLR